VVIPEAQITAKIEPDTDLFESSEEDNFFMIMDGPPSATEPIPTADYDADVSRTVKTERRRLSASLSRESQMSPDMTHQPEEEEETLELSPRRDVVVQSGDGDVFGPSATTVMKAKKGKGGKSKGKRSRTDRVSDCE
jgi:hypothetical protein